MSLPRPQGSTPLRLAPRIAAALLAALALLGGTPPAEAGRLREALEARRAERAGAAADDALAGEVDERPASASALPAGSQVLHDLAYGTASRQKLDVYLPPAASGSGPAAIVLMVHGGGWRLGDKAADRVVANKAAHWLAQGVVFVSINYRLLPQAEPLAQAEDVTRALAYVQAQAGEWHADPQRLVLMGHSAGAHLIALLSADPARAIALGARPWAGSVALDSAALDLVQLMEGRHARLYDRAFGADPATWRAASPQHHLSTQAVPMLLVCSTRRADDPCAQANRYAAAAKTLGVRTEILPQPLSHGDINGQLGLPGAYTAAVDGFLSSLPGFRSGP
ncbi:alpha/beta hydrolase fold domain-containing protein [Azoarcus sp. TTM-91]|uniref:alpha/beta hydrolase n=1 Tax=Azoarcus sp. TTM-91 TaxID=2691581 RepID=UPI00145EB8C7|nr:alpha/beta hydrolase [Azoarcus sp. TTM-91]NMG33529.1 alpha/beta hydrolase fold domain-containing protein [Azoarcus sp. TTM-91]